MGPSNDTAYSVEITHAGDGGARSGIRDQFTAEVEHTLPNATVMRPTVLSMYIYSPREHLRIFTLEFLHQYASVMNRVNQVIHRTVASSFVPCSERFQKLSYCGTGCPNAALCSMR